MSNKKNRQPLAPEIVERPVKLSEVEVALVNLAAAENQAAKAAADTSLAQRLQPIRAAHNLPEGVRADFRPTKDGKTLVMVVFEPKAAK